MKHKITIVICEGPHDVALLTKVLKVAGYKHNENEKIAGFPIPMSELLISEVKKANVSDLNIQEVRSAVLPVNTMIKEDTYLFLYALGGDKKTASRMRIVDTLSTFVSVEGEVGVLPKETELFVIYFFDADNDGIDKRLDYINEEINKFSGTKPFAESGTFCNVKGINMGCYIFCKNDSKTGKLEDILLPLFEKDNESIISEAQNYIKANYDKNRDKSKGFDEQKAIIGIAGQLQKSGSTNTVIISQTDYITEEKIKNNPKCIEIVDFFSKI